MSTLSTNIIQNVYNFGGTTACDAGQSTCPEGYGLYFPCLKDITRGQSVCFEFYVTDTAAQDVADLRDVDAITLELSGLYGCTYGEFSYPDDIKSLQREEYSLVYSNDFGPRALCNLNLIAIDKENYSQEMYLNNVDRDFYSGTEVEIAAYDTPTHIFVGWARLQDNEGCEEETWNDYIVSTDNVYVFTIEDDITLFALYRPRKEYRVFMDSTNKMSHYNITYDNIKYYIVHTPEESCDMDEDVHLEKVLEGYHLIAECVPNESSLDDDSEDNEYTYRFIRWKDGVTDRQRVFNIGNDTLAFEKDDMILLKSICSGPVGIYDLSDSSSVIVDDNFDEDGIHINTEFEEQAEYSYEGDNNIKDVDNVGIFYDGENGYLHFNYGSISVSSMGITEGIRVDLQAMAIEECTMTVSLNGVSVEQELSTEMQSYSYLFRKCDAQDITISMNGECLVDVIDLYDETIIDKGKAMLCLDSEDTSNIPSGPLSVSGAIMVNGSSYGLAKTQIGTVNKLKKITLTQ